MLLEFFIWRGGGEKNNERHKSVLFHADVSLLPKMNYQSVLLRCGLHRKFSEVNFEYILLIILLPEKTPNV